MALLLTSVPVQNIWEIHENRLLNCLAEAGLVDTVVTILNGLSSGPGGQLDEDEEELKVIDGDHTDGDQKDQADNIESISQIRVGDSFLHALA